MTDREELKTCPFCEGEGILQEATFGGGVIVSCSECGACINSAWPKECEGAAISQWNERANTPAPTTADSGNKKTPLDLFNWIIHYSDVDWESDFSKTIEEIRTALSATK